MQSGLIRQALAGNLNGRRFRLRWEGAFFSWHSLAHVNREICKRLTADPDVEIACIPTEPPHFGPEVDPALSPIIDRTFASLSAPVDVHIRHHYPPRFEIPGQGKLVLVAPWEYGYLPKHWVEAGLKTAKEIWCYSNYVRDVYTASGFPDHSVHVIRLGVDDSVFRPDAPEYVFTDEAGADRLAHLRQRSGSEKPFVFLFVGGIMERKGTDLLEAAFLRAFSAFDNVALVVKATGMRTVYRGSPGGERFRALAADDSRPTVIYFDDDLTPAQLAGVYSAADCLVQPYRAEGFCLPALEAMSAGIPVIVSEGGPTDDFVDETVGWRVKSTRKPYGDGRIGEWECCGPTWMFEPDLDDLCRAMREAFNNRAESRTRGEAGRARVLGGWTWDHCVSKLMARVRELSCEWDTDSATNCTTPEPPAKSKKRKSKSAANVLGAAAINDPPKLSLVSCTSSNDRRSSVRPEDTGKVIFPCSRPQPTISLCMIVRDEERVLDACLASAVPYFDEVILVDTGSVDSTVEIARRHGDKVKIFHFPWINDFSAARNYSLEQATSTWAMWMDADDELPKECGRQLRPLIALAEDRVAGFIMQVHIPPKEGELGYTVVDHLKCFLRRQAHRFEGRIHEQILEPIYRAGGIVEKTNLYVVHSGYDYSDAGQAKKKQRDYTILELDMAERPDHPFPRFNYGMTLFHHQEYDRAIVRLNECLERSKPEESTVRKVYAMLAGCHMAKRDLASARIAIDTGLIRCPLDKELLFRAGNLYRELGDLKAAEQFYLRLFSSGESAGVDSLDITMTTYKAHHNLALIYADMERHAEAEREYRAALAVLPTFTPSIHGLGELYLRMRRFEDARAALERLSAVGAAQECDSLRRRLTEAQGLALAF